MVLPKVAAFASLCHYSLFTVCLYKNTSSKLLIGVATCTGIVALLICFTLSFPDFLQQSIVWAHRFCLAFQLNLLVSYLYPHDYTNRINFALISIALGDLVRFFVLSRIKNNFMSKSRLRWDRETIRLERTLIWARKGSDFGMDDAALLDLISCSTRRLDPKMYFCLLCNDPETAKFAKHFEIIDIIRYNLQRSGQYPRLLDNREAQEAYADHFGEQDNAEIYSKIQQDLLGPAKGAGTTRKTTGIRGALEETEKDKRYIELKYLSPEDQECLLSTNLIKVIRGSRHDGCRVDVEEYKNLLKVKRMQLKGNITIESLRALMPSEKADTCFRILTQDFEAELSYADFEGCMRQMNNIRGCLVSTLQNNQRTMGVLNNSLFAIEAIAILSIVFMILDFGVVAKMIASVCVFAFLLVWELFDSFMFIVISHPYDVGDRVHIDGDNLIVKDIGLTSTTFERWNNEYVVIANKHIKTRTIKNIRRSKNQQWKITFYMSADVDQEKISTLKANMKEFVAKSPAFEHITISFDELKECRFYSISFTVKHSINHQNGFFMWKVQNKFMAKLVSECNANGITYVQPEISLM